MGKVWVLQTEIKGTGANVVPLERVLKQRRSAAEPPFRVGKPRTPPADTPEVKGPRRFRVVDVMTRQLVADDANARETINALKPFRSIVDVNIYVWEHESECWRMLTFVERNAIWRLRDR